MQDNQDKIWVEIETNKGTPNINAYRGRILLKDFQGWVSGKLDKKCIQLYEAYWVEGESWVEKTKFSNQPTRATSYRIMGEDNGQYNNHTGDIFLIAEQIVVIALLKGSFERDLFLQEISTTH